MSPLAWMFLFLVTGLVLMSSAFAMFMSVVCAMIHRMSGNKQALALAMAFATVSLLMAMLLVW